MAVSLTDQLDQLLAQLTPQLRRAFQDAISDIVDNAVLQAVIDAIERQDYQAAFEALGYSPAVFNPLLSALEDAFNAAGTLVMSTFPKRLPNGAGVNVVLRFNVRDPRAEAWLRDKSSTLITGIESDARKAVRNMLETGMQEGRNPRNIALDIVGRIDPVTGKRVGGVVGLGDREEFWQRNARARLLATNEADRLKYFDMELRDKRFDPIVAEAITKGEALPIDTVDKLMDRYRSNALRFRGETIGRTEAIHALNRSEYLATQQAVETGKVPESAVKRIWDTVGDNRVRPSHRALEGQTVGLNEPFVSPLTGARMMHPGDTSLGAGGEDVVACRCHVRTVVDWFSGVR